MSKVPRAQFPIFTNHLRLSKLARAHALFARGAVIAREDGPVGKRLVGCVVAARAAVPDAAVLRARPRMSAI